MFVLAILALAVSAVAVPFGIAADKNKGTFGTYTAEREECFLGDCEWIGTFESDDGTIRREDVRSKHDDLHELGDQVRLQKGLRGDESFYREDSKAWIIIVLGDIGCLIFVVLFLRGRWRARRERRQPAPAE